MYKHTITVHCKVCNEVLKYEPDTVLAHEVNDHSITIYPKGQIIYGFRLSETRYFCLEGRISNPCFTGAHFKNYSVFSDLWFTDKYNFIIINNDNCHWSPQKWVEFIKNLEILN